MRYVAEAEKSLLNSRIVIIQNHAFLKLNIFEFWNVVWVNPYHALKVVNDFLGTFKALPV